MESSMREGRQGWDEFLKDHWSHLNKNGRDWDGYYDFALIPHYATYLKSESGFKYDLHLELKALGMWNNPDYEIDIAAAPLNFNGKYFDISKEQWEKIFSYYRGLIYIYDRAAYERYLENPPL